MTRLGSKCFHFLKLITPERNRLAEGIIEESDCLKNWWGRQLIGQLDDATEM